ATAGQSPPTAPAAAESSTGQTSADPFDQLASTLAQKVATIENKIEQNVAQSTASIQQQGNFPIPTEPQPAPIPTSSAGQEPAQQMADLEKLLTANVSQFAR